ncbi:MAG: hypothetical protein GXY44_15500 [Phycisphaerales bacterium]|nr:hypothetical protein [Phycisphaerales bacterium]
MIPKKIDGLIAVGRRVSGSVTVKGSCTWAGRRDRRGHGGQEHRRTPKPRPQRLQKKLLDAGFCLGDDARLAELGLK